MAKQVQHVMFVSGVTKEMWLQGWRASPPNEHLNELYRKAYEKKPKKKKPKK